MMDSMCEIARRQLLDGTSLGVFRPKRVTDFKIEKTSIDDAKQRIARAWSAQTSLLDGVGSGERTNQLRELEQIPWTFAIDMNAMTPAAAVTVKRSSIGRSPSSTDASVTATTGVSVN
jgi:hypothetical protein